MNDSIRKQIISLRSEGLTYGEIQSKLDLTIPKSTLSYICKDIVLTTRQKTRIDLKVSKSLLFARQQSSLKAKSKREDRDARLLQKNLILGKIIQRVDVSRIALAMLFLGEGSKTHTATVMFGNSNPVIIDLYLRLFRKCFPVDESKFRCTVQCRVGQDEESLIKFWSSLTRIPLAKFYKTQIDPRTAGKPLKKLDYKGVCRIDYLSTEIVSELHQIIKIITGQ